MGNTVSKKMKMTLLSDTIFGNGVSVPGGEDASVLCDEQGFPYYKGGTFKGVFREELENLIAWKKECGEEAGKEIKIAEFLGEAGEDLDQQGKLRFEDFTISPGVRRIISQEIRDKNDVLSSFSYLRIFTKIDENGTVAEGSLRNYRCVKSGLTFYSTITCREEDCELVEEVLGLIKWIGTLRNRGFGKVRIEIA